MPGPIRSFSRVLYDNDNAVINREFHYTFIQYFDAHPGFTRIASNYGTNGTGLSGSFTFASSSGENAWAIYRSASSSVQYDLAFVWSYNSNYTANTWLATSNFGFGMAMAYHPSGAWSGSTGNIGADTFSLASNPWRSGSVVFPRINSEGGTYVTNKNGVMKPSSYPVGQLVQLFIVGDNETTYFWTQNSDTTAIGSAHSFSGFGTYTPLTASYNLPLFAFACDNLNSTNTYGANNVTEYTSEPGGISYTTGSESRSFLLNFPLYAARRSARPSPAFYGERNTKAYAFPVSLTSYETSHFHNVGYLSGVYVVAGNAFGNIQDVSRSFVSLKISNTPSYLSVLLPFSGSTDFFLKGTFE